MPQRITQGEGVRRGRRALTGKPHYLTETVPAGPRAAAEAEKVRTRLLNEVDEKRNPKTRATLNQLLDAYLEIVDVERPPKPDTSSTSGSVCDRPSESSR